jgi:hypothetical protein
MTILGESALVVVSMAHTTLSKEDKVGTSSTEAPMAQALVAQSGSKTSDAPPVDDDSKLLNFISAVPWIGCRTSLLS